MLIQTKTYCDLVARVSPRLTTVNVFASNSDWLNVLFTSAVIGQGNYNNNNNFIKYSHLLQEYTQPAYSRANRGELCELIIITNRKLQTCWQTENLTLTSLNRFR